MSEIRIEREHYQSGVPGVELWRVGWRPKYRPGWRFKLRRPWSGRVPGDDHGCYGSNDWVRAFTKKGAARKARTLHSRECPKPRKPSPIESERRP